MKAFLKELLLSFYARTFYSALAREKSGIGARFMLALSVALLLPAGLVLFPAARGMVSAAEVVAAQMPKMDFSGGRLAIDAPSPRVIPLGALGGKMAIAVDTNSSISDMTADEKRMREEHLLMLFGADGAVFRGRS
ncbi:MAG: hypothetical protein KGQ70_03430, partial [Alphaproteobacteria bacterium]|nr:hypothetical protein [Alphaproteobacteria bacterium]